MAIAPSIGRETWQLHWVPCITQCIVEQEILGETISGVALAASKREQQRSQEERGMEIASRGAAREKLKKEA